MNSCCCLSSCCARNCPFNINVKYDPGVLGPHHTLLGNSIHSEGFTKVMIYSSRAVLIRWRSVHGLLGGTLQGRHRPAARSSHRFVVLSGYFESMSGVKEALQKYRDECACFESCAVSQRGSEPFRVFSVVGLALIPSMQ